MPSTNRYEQLGTRPATILAETEANISLAIPLTSNIQALRFPHTLEIKPTKRNGLATLSIALIFRMRAIDKKRVKNKIGELEDSIVKEVDKSIKTLLKI